VNRRVPSDLPTFAFGDDAAGFDAPTGNRTPVSTLKEWRPDRSTMGASSGREPTTGLEPVTSSLPRKCSTD
jgi:hypothetical protein